MEEHYRNIDAYQKSNIVSIENDLCQAQKRKAGWPPRPANFPDLMTPTEAAMFLRLDQTGHTPKSSRRTLDFWRNQGSLKATKFARKVWFLKEELERFLRNKTEE